MAAHHRPVSPLHLPADCDTNLDSTSTVKPSTPAALLPSPLPLSGPYFPPSIPTTVQPSDKSPTPTRSACFSLSASPLPTSQIPLPSSPFPQSVYIPDSTDSRSSAGRLRRQCSMQSRTTVRSDDVEMDDCEEPAASDDEGLVDSRSGGATKRKKSHRFYCIRFPPCRLSFTRSEHLARHIRKHTGERPFQCHCSRRFSRLDNLRQHAHTVHMNEDIPVDSLAVSTRITRHLRTEKVRPGSARSRHSIHKSDAGPDPIRRHSKSLSMPSITSITSPSSSNGANEDPTLRHLPPLMMTSEPRSRLSIGSYRSLVDSDYSTPISATFSAAGQSSPRWGSGVASPASSHSRSQSLYVVEGRTSDRRPSVLSSGNTFSSSIDIAQPGSAIDAAQALPYFAPAASVGHGHAPRRPAFAPGHASSFSVGAVSNLDASGSVFLPCRNTAASVWSARRDSIPDFLEKRSWQPDVHADDRQSAVAGSNAATPSRLQHHKQPTLPKAATPIRLPGIESFDPFPCRPASPMLFESERHAPLPLDLPCSNNLMASQYPSNPRIPTFIRRVSSHEGTRNTSSPSSRVQNSFLALRDDASAWTAEDTRPASRDLIERVILPLPTSSLGSRNVAFFAASSRGNPSVTDRSSSLSARSLVSHNYSNSWVTPSGPRRHGCFHRPQFHSSDGSIQNDGPPCSATGSQTYIALSSNRQSPHLHLQAPQHLSPRSFPHRLSGEAKTSFVDRMVHPNIAAGFASFPARALHENSKDGSPPEPHFSADNPFLRPAASELLGLGRLDGMVAVASSAGNTATAY